ncbi:MAG TPA: hypothetical protein VN253_02260 [Kofleriaceae bacterium]|nr:hypothetical protein [Kofleriaceae bacterium]
MRTVTRIALAAVLGCACKKPDEPPPVPSQGIELVQRGAIPHQNLRYQLTKGVKTAIELERDLDVSMGSLQRTMPTSVVRMEISADEILPDGSAKMRTRVVSASARDRPNTTVPIETLNAQATMLAGLEITGTLTPRGRIWDTHLASGGKDLPAKTVQQIEQMLKADEDVAMPLPEPGVGVGAIWRVRKDVILLGVKMETITEVELTAVDGPRVSYLLRTEVKGDDQTADIDGVKAEVSRIRGGGTGKGVIDLSRMTMTGEQEDEMSFDLAAMDNHTSAKMRRARRMRSPAPAQGAQSAP